MIAKDKVVGPDVKSHIKKIRGEERCIILEFVMMIRSLLST